MTTWKNEHRFFSSAGAGGGVGAEGDGISARSTFPWEDYVSARRKARVEKKYGILVNDRLVAHNIEPGMCYFVRYQNSDLPDHQSLTLFENVDKDFGSAHQSPIMLNFVTGKEKVPYSFDLTLGGEVYFDAGKNIIFWHYKSGSYGSRGTDPLMNPGFPADKFVYFSVIDVLDKFAIKYKLDSYLHLLIKLKPDTPCAPYFLNPIGDAFFERITSVTNEEDQRAVVDALIRQYNVFYENFEKLPSTEAELLELTRVFQIATFRAETSTDIDCSRNASELRASPTCLMSRTPGP